MTMTMTKRKGQRQNEKDKDKTITTIGYWQNNTENRILTKTIGQNDHDKITITRKNEKWQKIKWQ